jgi:PAS domain S-box-containing protein
MKGNLASSGSREIRARLADLSQSVEDLDDEQLVILNEVLNHFLPGNDGALNDPGRSLCRGDAPPVQAAASDPSTADLDQLPVMAWRSGVDMTCAYVNQSWQAFTGKTLNEVQSGGWAVGIHPDDLKRYRTTYQSALAERKPFEIEYRLIHHSGGYRWMLDLGKPQMDERGALTGYLGACYDLTVRKDMEKALRDSEARFKGLFEYAPDAIIVLDESGSIQLANQHAGKMFGYPLSELVGQQVEVLMPEIFRKRHRQHVREYFRGPHIRPMGECIPLLGLRKDQSSFSVDVTLGPLETETGLLVLAIIRDITRRKQTEQALVSSEGRFRTIFSESMFGIVLIDPGGRIVDANPAMAAMLGHDTGEIVGKLHSDLVDPEDEPACSDLLDRIRAGESTSALPDLRYRHPDGTVLWTKFSGSRLPGSQNDPSLILGVVENITAQKEIESELAEVSRRLIDSAELERLNLSRELHDGPLQDLQAILMQLASLDEGNAEPRNGGHDPGESMRVVKKEVQKVTHSLRALCGELRPPSLTPFGLEKAIRSHVNQIKEKYPDIQIVLDLKSDHDILNERVRLALFRIYQHLLANALRHSDASQISIHFSYDEHEVSLVMVDDGKGFSLPKRWLTLARTGHFGLVGSMERAESIGGRLSIETTPGGGTTVRVVAPRQEELQVAVRERFTALAQH